MAKIAVVGSINMDFVTQAEKFPQVGETLMGLSFHTSPGGKGANQAVAIAKLGHDVYFYGAVGKDDIGESLLKNFERYGIHTEAVAKVEDSSGMAQITVAQKDNHIIVVPGANQWVTPKYVEEYLPEIQAMDFVILQLEIPFATVETVIHACALSNTPVLLNPAPAPVKAEDLVKLRDLIPLVRFFTPNTTELGSIFATSDVVSILSRFPAKIIMTMGKDGVGFVQPEDFSFRQLPCIPTEVVDTTGAGDSFNAGMLHGVLAGWSLSDACSFGQCVSSLAIRSMGAQVAMPTLAQVEALYRETQGTLPQYLAQ